MVMVLVGDGRGPPSATVVGAGGGVSWRRGDQEPTLVVVMLSGWRVLDLTDTRGEVGPYLLADLGADVIKVEPYGGCVGRALGDDELAFDAYNGNKRTVELTGDDDTDRRLVVDLLAGADLVFDAGPPGRLASLGVDRDRVRDANDRVVVVTVTPFGLDGPRADQPATEFTIASLGGPVRLQGVPDRAPVQMSIPQVWRHAGAEAALASLIAHRRMLTTGRAQFVDVSAQSVMTWTMLNAMEAFEVQGRDFERRGSELALTVPIQLRMEAADGHVIGVPTGRSVQHLLPWLLDEGIVDATWADTDWGAYDHDVISGNAVAQPLGEVAEAVYELCRRYPKWDLFRRSITYGATLAPLNSLVDLLGFDHLQARGFWVEPAGSTAGDAASNGSGPLPATPPSRAPGGFFRRNEVRPAVVRGRPARISGTAPAWAAARRRPDGTPDRDPNGTAEGPNGTADGRPENDTADLPLAGVRVVDFSWIGVGPITAKCLADHGATVVRVESENRIDGLRNQPPYHGAEPGIDRSNFFGTFNTSKLGICLDLKTDSGIDVARRLGQWADVVVESFTPGTIDRLGLGYDDLRADNPGLIMMSTSLLGQGSSASIMAGYGYHAAAIAGFQNLVGWPDLPPDGPWVAYTDTIGPRFITTALLAALDHRTRTGEGSHIEAAQLEVALQLLAPELADFQRTGIEPPRRGNRDPVMAPQGAYPTRGDDQWLAISIVDDEAWARLVELLGRPEWATEPALATAAGRHTAQDHIDEQLAAWTVERDGPETERLLASSGIAAGVIQSSRQLSEDPQYRHRNFYRYLEHSEVGVSPYAGHQYRIDGYDHGPRRAAPCLGEHTYEILTDLLGMSADEVGELAMTGALI
jgi:crotonobetainyl-CoA:carnitine CoA-transferase CaiB-like acyl-CoA transferase